MSDGSAQPPLLAGIMGRSFDTLAPVVRRHFSLSAGGRQQLSVRGVMSEIWHSNLAKCWLPAGMALGALIPWRGRNVPAVVHYRVDGRRLLWRREFQFPRRTHVFSSCMEAETPGVGVEYVRFGVGTRMQAEAIDGRLRFRSIGFVWQGAGRSISLPLRPIMGEVTVEEWALDEHRFAMHAEIRHPWFGLLFRYAGEFELPDFTAERW